MYSLNVVLPGRVAAVAADLHPRLTTFERVRERHTLVVKRFEDAQVRDLSGGATAPQERVDRLRERLRPLLAAAPAFPARVTGVDYFADPPTGSAPVVYLAVESDGLRDLHRRLCDAFGAVEGLEGDDYTPHVTLARDGDVADAAALADVDLEPVSWTVSELGLWSRDHREFAARFRLKE